MARRVSMMVLLVAVLGLLVWAGVYNYRQREQDMQQAQAKLIKLNSDSPNGGTASPDASAMPSELGKDLRGKQAPGFELKDVDGKPVSSREFAGHPMIVNFWATYCGPCKLEMPWFEEFSHKYAAQGLKVVGIDDEESVAPADVAAAAKKIGVTYPILIANSKTEADWGLGDYLPVTFYIDAHGTVMAQGAGAPSKDEAEANVAKILAGKQ